MRVEYYFFIRDVVIFFFSYRWGTGAQQDCKNLTDEWSTVQYIQRVNLQLGLAAFRLFIHQSGHSSFQCLPLVLWDLDILHIHTGVNIISRLILVRKMPHYQIIESKPVMFQELYPHVFNKHMAAAWTAIREQPVCCTSHPYSLLGNWVSLPTQETSPKEANPYQFTLVSVHFPQNCFLHLEH